MQRDQAELTVPLPSAELTRVASIPREVNTSLAPSKLTRARSMRPGGAKASRKAAALGDARVREALPGAATAPSSGSRDFGIARGRGLVSNLYSKYMKT